MTQTTQALPVWKRTATGWQLLASGEVVASLYRLAPDARADLTPDCAFEIFTRDTDGRLRFSGYGSACTKAKRAAELEIIGNSA